MTALVLQLQADAMDGNVPVVDLVRKALVVATKLEIGELRDWCENELRGYTDADVPPYRRVRGEIKAWNPFNGWIPVVFQNAEVENHLSHRNISQPVGELQHLIREGGTGVLSVPFDPDTIQKAFASSQEFKMGMVPTLIVSRTDIVGILDAVRNSILEWALKLERQGVIGENMTFSASERERASSIIYNISTFQGILGDVRNSTVAVGDYSAIFRELERLNLPADDRAEIRSILETLPTAPADEKPPLLQRGRAWLDKYGMTIGTLAQLVSTALEVASKR